GKVIIGEIAVGRNACRCRARKTGPESFLWWDITNFVRATSFRRIIGVKCSFSHVVLLATCAIAVAQPDPKSRAMNQPVPPFRILDNLYYVGANEVTSFLITTPEGHFVLDGGFAETAPQIERNIAQLGFHLRDVKF